MMVSAHVLSPMCHRAMRRATRSRSLWSGVFAIMVCFVSVACEIPVMPGVVIGAV